MTTNLVQLTFKSGIQRDGSNFQGDYCTDGQWVRFQRGKVRRMGGQTGCLPTSFPTSLASNLHVEPNTTANQMVCYFGVPTGIYKVVLGRDMNVVTASLPIFTLAPSASIIWQSDTVIWVQNNNNRYIAFLSTNTGLDVTDTGAGSLYYTEITPIFSDTTTQVADLPVDVNGGICFASPYLFAFGTKGQVYYSRNNAPFNFTALTPEEKAGSAPGVIPVVPPDAGSDGGSIQISNDKVIYGAQIRAGSNAPGLLFWTLSSVVRVTNVSNAINPEFKVDAISKSSSILSQKAVVEYDGLFFWPGTDRFFVYNGVVQEMANFTNLNYFYDNLDPQYDSRVFGVKQTRYGEIWWFYPERGSNGVCTHAVIYNKRENSWYDTVISRTAGTFFEDYGIMLTYGRQLTIPFTEAISIWQHETSANNYGDFVAGSTDPVRQIEASFTTPVFGWSSFNPAYAGGGSKTQPIDRFLQITRIEPDFALLTGAVPPGIRSNYGMDVTILGKTYAQDSLTAGGPFSFRFNTSKIDLSQQYRQMQLRFSTPSTALPAVGSAPFEMGSIFMLVGIGDGQ